MKNKATEIKTVFVQCDCHVHGIKLEKFKDEDELFLCFWVLEWYSEDNFLRGLWNRIKLAWKVLKNGDYFLKEITLKEDKVNELIETLKEFQEMNKNL